MNSPLGDSLSLEETRELADSVGITVRDEEVGQLRDAVESLLEGADELHGVPLPEEQTVADERSWRKPETDPHNAFSTKCDVPPTDSDGLLAGLEVGVKDAIAVAGVPMQCGSDMMRGFVPTADATVVRRLLNAGATITAKTNLDMFAGSARGTTSDHGPVQNPRDPERSAGGSSGGSAAAVATGEVDVALGSDTGGSIRIPASFCGVVGLKPTYGLVPLTGAMENTYTQDHIGPITSTVADAAGVLEAVAGRDRYDPASLTGAGRTEYRVGGYVDAVDSPGTLDSVTIGVLQEGMGEGVRPAVVDGTEDVADRLADAGATVHRVSVDYYEHFRAVKNVLSATEIAAHWRDDAAPVRRGGLVDPTYQSAFAERRRTRNRGVATFYKAKLLAGARLLTGDAGASYTRAQAAREVLRDEFEAVLDRIDALLLPTMPDVAPLLEDAADPGFDYARNTRPANVTRLPALTLPHGTVDGLPIGVQLVGEAFSEAQLLGIGAAIEPELESPSA